jgi:hypothetical protein
VDRSEVRAALAALATLPDTEVMGCMQDQTGAFVPDSDYTVADLRRTLIEGTNTVSPEMVVRSVHTRHVANRLCGQA